MPVGDRRQAEEKLVDVAHQHPRVGEQCVDVAGGDVMEVFQQHRARRDLAALETPRPPLRRQRRLRLHRRQQHDIVVDFDLDFAAAQAEPADGLRTPRYDGRAGRTGLRGNRRAASALRPAARCGGGGHRRSRRASSSAKFAILEHAGRAIAGDRRRTRSMRAGSTDGVRYDLRIEIVVVAAQTPERRRSIRQ